MLKFVISIAVLLVSLLVLLPAPAYPLWLLSIIVAEFPWLPFCMTTVLLFWRRMGSVYAIPSNLLLIVALCLFTTPVLRARTEAKDLSRRLSDTFGVLQRPSPELRGSVFNVVKLFNSVKNIPYIDKPYKESPEQPLHMAFYPSVLAGPRPCVIVIHGGSWKSGDNTQLPELNSILARQGYHVAAINYRLAPDFKCPAPVEDVTTAMRYLRTHAGELSIDASRFVLLGRSAGAQIALLTAYTLHDPAIKGVVDFYGPADMVWGYAVPSNPLVMDSRKVMEDYLGGPYDNFVQSYEQSSPIRFVSRDSPPTLLIHGKNDPLVAYEHSRRLNEKLSQYQVKHYLLTLPWATHGFDYNIHGPGGQLSTYAVSYFLNTVTQY